VKQVSNEVSFNSSSECETSLFIPEFSDTPHSFECSDWLLIKSH